MKQILIILMIFCSIVAKGQITREVKVDTVATGFVLDTVLVETEKFTIAREGIERIERILTKVFDREKVATDTMLYLNESKMLINEMYKLLNKYAKVFMRVDTVNVVKTKNDYYVKGETEGIVKQYQELNTRIEELRNDPEIKHVDAVREFQDIQEKKARLERIYQNIKSKEKK